MRVLNLYAGLGGNRKLWRNVEVTAVELDPKIAAVYQFLYPLDTVVVGDAHQFLLANYCGFDFIWSSPPCQSHSKMARANCRTLPRYPDLSLYEEILFLQSYCKTKWVVENVRPYYQPLVKPTVECGRHLFWSNFSFPAFEVPSPPSFIASNGQATHEQLKEWLGIRYEGSLYHGTNHCPAQVLRNCVHPDIGLHIFSHATLEAEPMLSFTR